MNFLVSTGQERNETIILFSIFLGLFRPILASNEPVMVFFNFLGFFAIFFLIFYLVPDRNETDRELLFSVFLSLFQPILD